MKKLYDRHMHLDTDHRTAVMTFISPSKSAEAISSMLPMTVDREINHPAAFPADKMIMRIDIVTKRSWLSRSFDLQYPAFFVKN